MNWVQWFSETPFGRSTRQNIRELDRLNYTAGATVTQSIPRVGFLARLFLLFNGTLNVTLGTGSATLDTFGPFNLYNRIRIAANAGQDIYSVSGWMTHVLNMLMRDKWSPRESGSPTDPAYAESVYSAGVANGANRWEHFLVIPVAVNDMTEAGLILLQNELGLTQLAISFNGLLTSANKYQAPVVVSGGATATLTGTVTPVVEYFAVPADSAAWPDILWLHQVLEQTQPIASTGDQQVNLIRDNIYLQIIHQIVYSGFETSATPQIDRLRLVINQSDIPYDMSGDTALARQRYLYSRDLPPGVFVHELFHQGIAGFGGERDLLNGRATSELQSVITIPTGVTLGTDARIQTVTRQLVRLTPPTVQGA